LPPRLVPHVLILALGLRLRDAVQAVDGGGERGHHAAEHRRAVARLGDGAQRLEVAVQVDVQVDPFETNSETKFFT
jgi:hypothetical protein